MASNRTEGAREAPIPWSLLMLMLAASRLALELVGMLSARLLASGLSVMKGNLVYHAPVALPLDIWARWDSEWYLLIAERGYRASDAFMHLAVGYEPDATAGFLPLYPLLIRLLAPLTGSVAAGVLISNACLAGSLGLLYTLARDAAGGGRTGRRAGLAACAALLAFPMSLFLSAVYAESLFLLLSLATFCFLHRGRIGAAAACAALAAVTRPAGLLLALPILWECVPGGSRGMRRAARALWVLLVPAGLAAYMIWCARALGDPLAFFHRQQHWRGAMAGPWRAFARWWESGPAVHGAHNSTVELVVAILCVALLPLLFVRLRTSYAIYAAAAVLLPLCSTLWSFSRFALTVFPVFILAGESWARRGSRLVPACLLISAITSGFFMTLFASWWWAG
jgi:hypothetical protein